MTYPLTDVRMFHAEYVEGVITVQVPLRLATDDFIELFLTKEKLVTFKRVTPWKEIDTFISVGGDASSKSMTSSWVKA